MIPLVLAALAGGAATAALLAPRLLAGRRAERSGSRPGAEAGPPAAPGLPLPLLAAAIHDLRTPLSAIRGYQELLQEGLFGTLDPAGADAVLRIGRSAEQLASLLDAVEDLSRVLEDRGATHPVVVALEPILAGSIAAARAAAEEQGLTLHADIPGALPELATDPRLLRRALDLTLIAAVRAAGAGTLTVRAHARPDHVLVEVAGAGLDIPAGGEPAPDDAPTFPGRLRLAIAHHLATALGGELHPGPADGPTPALRLRLARPTAGAAGRAAAD